MNTFTNYYFTATLEESVFDSIKNILKEYNDFNDGGVEGNISFTDNTKSLLEIWNNSGEKDTSERISEICWVTNDDLYKTLIPIIEHANQFCNWNFDVNKVEDLQYTRYGVDGHYNWHFDECNWPHMNRPDSVRKLSFTLLLNDEFEGGEFQMKLPDEKTIQLKKGDIVIFHSDILHRVSPVISGTRESLVGWIQGPPWR